MIERNTAEIPTIPDYEPRNVKPNTNELYLASLPTYDLSGLGLVGLQSIFATLTTKLAETKELLYSTMRTEERIKLFRERDILEKTLSAVSDGILREKRRELEDRDAQYEREVKERALRMQKILQDDAREYDVDRGAREYEISLLQQKEIDRIKDAKLKKLDELSARQDKTDVTLKPSTTSKLSSMKKKAEDLSKTATTADTKSKTKTSTETKEKKSSTKDKPKK